MKTKYDWSGVPDDVETIATDSKGVVKGFLSNSPMQTNQGWTSNYDYYYLTKQEPYKGNWQDSLEERPK